MKTIKELWLIPVLIAGILFLTSSSCEKEEEEFPDVTTSDVTEITNTTALSGGRVLSDGGATITSRGVVWSTSDYPTTSDNKTNDGTGAGSYTSLVTGLEPGTNYYLRAYATNSKGTTYGSIMTFETLNLVTGTFTDDRDGNVYNWVEIGDQKWMAENLRYLPFIFDPATGSGSADHPHYFVYDYTGSDVNEAKETEAYQLYGVLYNYKAAVEACPEGWHLPSDAEWTTLVNFVGGELIAGGKLKIAGTSYWETPNSGATNEYGFFALPGGARSFGGIFTYAEKMGNWWSSTEVNPTTVWYRYMHYNNARTDRAYYGKIWGLSVRCVMD